MSGIMLARRAGGFKTGIALPNIGDAWLGGYYAGIIDTTKGNIIAADAFQTGQRFAVIVAGASLDVSSKAWKTTNTDGPTGVYTRWNGLGATVAMASVGSSYPAAYYCNGLSYPGDGASQWYLPAMDELEIIYRNLKAGTDTNNTSGVAGKNFPASTVYFGENPSSDPAGAAYSSSVPAQTTVAAFKSGGAQAIGATGTDYRYWTATQESSGKAWAQLMSNATLSGYQASNPNDTAHNVRPIRRLVLT